MTELSLDQLRARRRDRRIAIALIASGVAVGLIGSVVLTGGGAAVQAERDVIAQQARAAAEPTLALCRAPSQVAPVLNAAGLCANAEQVVSSPIVTRASEPLPPERIDAIVASVLPLLPDPGLRTPVSGVLSVLAADPATDALDEASTRAVVAGAVGSSDPDPVQEPPAGSGQAPQPVPERVTDLRFEEVDGRCVGVVTLERADGTTRQERSPAPAGACGMAPAPNPDPDPPTEPVEPSTPVEPAPGTDEPSPPASGDPGAPSDGSADPSPTGEQSSSTPLPGPGADQPGGLRITVN